MELITYRHSVRGALEGFLEKTKFKGLLHSDGMIEIAASVARHQEEGVQFFPTVFICADAVAFLKHAPGGEMYVLGENSDIRQGMITAMKKSLPLTSRDWNVIVEVKDGRCRFGVFKASSVPTALGLETTYFVGETTSLPAAIQVSSARPSVVVFRSDCGESLTVCFTHDEVQAENLVHPSDSLADVILSGVEDGSLKARTKAFLLKVIENALKGSHGTLVCVLDKKWASEELELPAMLRDGIRIRPPIDFTALIGRARRKCRS